MLVVSGGLALILTIGVTRERAAQQPPRQFTVQELKPPPGATAPRAGLPAPEDRPNASDQAALDDWADQVARSTRIPARVLVAYGRAEMWMRSQQPGCKINWVTIAGIGRAESGHGSFGGAQIGLDGRVTKPIIGPPLDGQEGVKAIPDTEGGRLDGDTQWDRAVGPMQFLPQTWDRWGERATGDGADPDPQHIDDAALGTARYLCSGGADLTTPDGWWKAVLTYNQSVEYGQDVFSGADAYAAASAAP
ncbi:murein transglycosylase [Amycolatopsis antarctica]|uniref:Murein transglycosylase n=1 Tax=Amycolatopsis antarctica TaxID=1854586 RepID=A0A263D5J9_9PSEU|nr:murein transglycosylase [Amycolatopsis antarctica]OZM73782.1 murein transglycosylase [Amycolatopsis antarctica]